MATVSVARASTYAACLCLCIRMVQPYRDYQKACHRFLYIYLYIYYFSLKVYNMESSFVRAICFFISFFSISFFFFKIAICQCIGHSFICMQLSLSRGYFMALHFINFFVVVFFFFHFTLLLCVINNVIMLSLLNFKRILFALDFFLCFLI